MEIAFDTQPLRELCERKEQAISELGEAVAASLRRRLADLEAARAVTELPMGEIRQETATTLKLELVEGWWLRLAANHPKNPTTADGKLDWQRIARIKILAAEGPE